MNGLTFTQLWAKLSASEKDEMSFALARKCNVRVGTVPIWGCGARKPKPLSQDIIVQHLNAQGYDTDCRTLFPQ